MTQLQQHQTQGGMLPSQSRSIADQISMLQKRLSAPEGAESPEAERIRKTMQASGMMGNFSRPPATAAAAPNYYNFGASPGAPPAQPRFNKYDFLRDPYLSPWEEHVNSSAYGGNIRGG